MAYLTIGGTAYLVQVGQSRGRRLQIEHRRRAISGALLVDSIATKREAAVTITGAVSAGRFFTPAEAEVLIGVLATGAVAISGDIGSFTARPRDIGWVDVQDYRTSPPTTYRHVTATLEEV